MKIHLSYGITRPKPKEGDVRYTKKHGAQVRVHEKHDGMWVVGSGGRYRYDWVAITPENIVKHRLQRFNLVVTP